MSNEANNVATATKEVSETVVNTTKEVANTVNETVANTASLADFSIDKMQLFFEAAEKVMAQYGGDAVDLGLNVLRIDAFTNMYGELIMLVILAFTAKPTIKFFKQWNTDTIAASNYDEVEDSNEKSRLKAIYHFWDLPLRGFIGYCMIILYGTVFLVNITCLNLWAWVGVVYPELYAVNKLILANIGG